MRQRLLWQSLRLSRSNSVPSSSTLQRYELVLETSIRRRRDERERSLSTRSPPQDEDLEALCEVGMLQRICVSQAMP